MHIFVRLCGFHQLMSFLGSKGFLMEGSGLRKALETVYAPNTVTHMLSGKAYSRAIRGHTLVILALLALILEPHLDTLSSEEVEKIVGLSNLDKSLIKTDDTFLSLQSWFADKNNELRSRSRTSA